MRASGSAVIVLAVALSACKVPHPPDVLKVSDVETHWAIDSASGTTQYIAPVVRFRVTNVGPEPLTSIQATATFRRKGEENVTWGSDFRAVATRQAPLGPGQHVDVVMKSDARYFSTGAAETMFTHAEFRDARVEFFLRIRSSPWSPFGAAEVERRIGARGVQAAAAPSPAPPASAPAQP
ncbi:MAG TPA: hypothetical protein VFM29_09475 [Vicinamibacteria bacterium]|nr:hypothetical protein [Vicinamibacteria bacterium]